MASSDDGMDRQRSFGVTKTHKPRCSKSLQTDSEKYINTLAADRAHRNGKKDTETLITLTSSESETGKDQMDKQQSSGEMKTYQPHRSKILQTGLEKHEKTLAEDQAHKNSKKDDETIIITSSEPEIIEDEMDGPLSYEVMTTYQFRRSGILQGDRDRHEKTLAEDQAHKISKKDTETIVTITSSESETREDKIGEQERFGVTKMHDSRRSIILQRDSNDYKKKIAEDRTHKNSKKDTETIITITSSESETREDLMGRQESFGVTMMYDARRSIILQRDSNEYKKKIAEDLAHENSKKDTETIITITSSESETREDLMGRQESFGVTMMYDARRSIILQRDSNEKKLVGDQAHKKSKKDISTSFTITSSEPEISEDEMDGQQSFGDMKTYQPRRSKILQTDFETHETTLAEDQARKNGKKDTNISFTISSSEPEINEHEMDEQQGFGGMKTYQPRLSKIPQTDLGTHEKTFASDREPSNGRKDTNISFRISSSEPEISEDEMDGQQSFGEKKTCKPRRSKIQQTDCEEPEKTLVGDRGPRIGNRETNTSFTIISSESGTGEEEVHRRRKFGDMRTNKPHQSEILETDNETHDYILEEDRAHKTGKKETKAILDVISNEKNTSEDEIDRRQSLGVIKAFQPRLSRAKKNVKKGIKSSFKISSSEPETSEDEMDGQQSFRELKTYKPHRSKIQQTDFEEPEKTHASNQGPRTGRKEISTSFTITSSESERGEDETGKRQSFRVMKTYQPRRMKFPQTEHEKALGSDRGPRHGNKETNTTLDMSSSERETCEEEMNKRQSFGEMKTYRPRRSKFLQSDDEICEESHAGDQVHRNDKKETKRYHKLSSSETDISVQLDDRVHKNGNEVTQPFIEISKSDSENESIPQFYGLVCTNNEEEARTVSESDLSPLIYDRTRTNDNEETQMFLGLQLTDSDNDENAHDNHAAQRNNNNETKAFEDDNRPELDNRVRTNDNEEARVFFGVLQTDNENDESTLEDYQAEGNNEETIIFSGMPEGDSPHTDDLERTNDNEETQMFFKVLQSDGKSGESLHENEQKRKSNNEPENISGVLPNDNAEAQIHGNNNEEAQAFQEVQHNEVESKTTDGFRTSKSMIMLSSNEDSRDKRANKKGGRTSEEEPEMIVESENESSDNRCDLSSSIGKEYRYFRSRAKRAIEKNAESVEANSPKAKVPFMSMLSSDEQYETANDENDTELNREKICKEKDGDKRGGKKKMKRGSQIRNTKGKVKYSEGESEETASYYTAKESNEGDSEFEINKDTDEEIELMTDEERKREESKRYVAKLDTKRNKESGSDNESESYGEYREQKCGTITETDNKSEDEEKPQRNSRADDKTESDEDINKTEISERGSWKRRILRAPKDYSRAKRCVTQRTASKKATTFIQSYVREIMVKDQEEALYEQTSQHLPEHSHNKRPNRKMKDDEEWEQSQDESSEDDQYTQQRSKKSKQSYDEPINSKKIEKINELSEYEKMIQERIKQKKQFLLSLGISHEVKQLKKLKPKKRVCKKKEKQVKPPCEPRRSNRQRTKTYRYEESDSSSEHKHSQ